MNETPMTYEIVSATHASMAETEAWLDEEESVYESAHKAWVAGGYADDPPSRGFRCNWDTVKRSWRENSSRVDILMVDGLAIGFLAGRDILEVRPDRRGEGWGRLLAEFMIEVARGEGLSVIEIEIAPLAAQPFWERMGFTVVPDRRGNGDGIYAYRVLPRVYSLSNGERVSFSVEFYSEDESYQDNPKPFSSFTGVGERQTDGSVQLPSRAFCFEPTHEPHQDYFIRLELDGTTLHFDKGKYDTSRALGIQRDAGYIYFVDRITPQLSINEVRVQSRSHKGPA